MGVQINEVRYRDFTTTGEPVEELDLETFTKLYINHRPPYPLDRSDIEKVREEGPANAHSERRSGPPRPRWLS